MKKKPYSVEHERGEQLEPKQGHDHEGKPVDMGAPLDAKEMAEGLSKMLGGLPIEIVDKREEREMKMKRSTQFEAEPDDDYAAERVGAREEAMGKQSGDDLKDAFVKIASRGSEINNALDVLLWGIKISGDGGYCEHCGETSKNQKTRLEAMEAFKSNIHGIATEIVTIASSRVTKLTPIEDRLGVEDADS